MTESEKIISTIVDMFIATDRRNWEEVIAQFSNQVLIDYSSMSGNPSSRMSPRTLVESWQNILPGFNSTQHQVTNFQVNLNQNRAHVYCYGTAYHYLPNAKGDVWIVVGTYDFVLESNGDQWKINAMKFNLKFQSGNTDLPGEAMSRA